MVRFPPPPPKSHETIAVLGCLLILFKRLVAGMELILSEGGVGSQLRFEGRSTWAFDMKPF